MSEAEIRALPVIRPGVNCWNCMKIFLIEGHGPWSELTPGDEQSIGCGLRHWRLNGFYSEDEMREKLQLAEQCPDFEPYIPKELR